MFNENGNRNREDEKLSGVLSALPKVDAPMDFDFRLRARLARANSRGSSWVFIRALKFAIPAVIILGLGGFYLSNLYRNSNLTESVSQVESPQTVASETLEPLQTPTQSNETNGAIAGTNTPSVVIGGNKGFSKRDEIASTESSTAVKKRTASDKESRGVSSRDSALSEVDDEVYPRGVSPKKRLETSQNSGTNEPLKVSDLLSVLGIEIETAEGKLKVRSVKEGSVAAGSGVKTGDILMAIDGLEISNSPITVSKFEGKTLNVKRGTEELEIPLKLRP